MGLMITMEWFLKTSSLNLMRKMALVVQSTITLYNYRWKNPHRSPHEEHSLPVQSTMTLSATHCYQQLLKTLWTLLENSDIMSELDNLLTRRINQENVKRKCIILTDPVDRVTETRVA